MTEAGRKVGPFLERLKKLAGRIALGRCGEEDVQELEGLTDPRKHPPELAEFAESFSMMRVQVDIRIAQLQETIEELRKAKAQLEDYSKHLEEKVAERTADLAAANKKLEHLANHDALTGLSNRRVFFERFGQEWERLGREGKPLSVILMDVDHFKLYNDTYGHRAGDDCLREVSRVLGAAPAGPGAVAARYGGEEFVLLLPESSSERALAVAEAVRSGVQGLGIAHAKNTAASCVTISLGVSSALPAPGGGPPALLEAADQALYRAKREKGRNSAAFQAP